MMEDLVNKQGLIWLVARLADVVKTSINKLKETIDEKVSWTPNNEEGKGRQIVMDNHGMIVGLPNTGEQENKAPDKGAANLVMLSKWNVSDFGSTKYPINLNGSKERPTYNDTKEIALVEDLNDLVDEEALEELKQRIIKLEQIIEDFKWKFID